MSDDNRLDRLPRWAQEEILRLRLSVEHWKNRAGFVAPQASVSFPAVILDPFATGGEDRVRVIEPDSTIRFQVSERFHIDVRHLFSRQDKGSVYVSAADSLRIQPSSSNAFSLWPSWPSRPAKEAGE